MCCWIVGNASESWVSSAVGGVRWFFGQALGGDCVCFSYSFSSPTRAKTPNASVGRWVSSPAKTNTQNNTKLCTWSFTRKNIIGRRKIDLHIKYKYKTNEYIHGLHLTAMAKTHAHKYKDRGRAIIIHTLDQTNNGNKYRKHFPSWCSSWLLMLGMQMLCIQYVEKSSECPDFSHGFMCVQWVCQLKVKIL